jgi:hypothetical protein
MHGLLYCQMFSNLIYLHLFPDSMSNLSIETSALDAFLKISSFTHSLGNFGTSSSFPFPKARNLKRRSLKMFVLRLFGKFMPLRAHDASVCRSARKKQRTELPRSSGKDMWAHYKLPVAVFVWPHVDILWKVTNGPIDKYYDVQRFILIGPYYL